MSNNQSSSSSSFLNSSESPQVFSKQVKYIQRPEEYREKLRETGRRQGRKILNEDQYVDTLKTIIQRNYYPDLPKLKRQVEYLRALEANDPDRVFRAKETILTSVRREQQSQNQPNSVRGEKGSLKQYNEIQHTPTFRTPNEFSGFENEELKTHPSTPSRDDSISTRKKQNTSLTDAWEDDEDDEQELKSSSNNNLDSSLTKDEKSNEDSLFAKPKQPSKKKRKRPEDFDLDEFFARYTSEDDVSFKSIVDQMQQEHREKLEYLNQVKNKPSNNLIEASSKSQNQQLLLEWKDDHQNSDSKLNNQQSKISDLTAKNPLMFLPDTPSQSEEMEESLAPPKKIQRNNTRLDKEIVERLSNLSQKHRQKNEEEMKQKNEASSDASFSERQMKRGGVQSYDLDDITATPRRDDGDTTDLTQSPKVNGYGFIATPSPAPGGADGTPIMTWGEIEGSPIVMEQLETPLSVSGGHYHMPEESKRDEIAHRLADEAGSKINQRKRIDQRSSARNQSSQPSPYLGRSITPGSSPRTPKSFSSRYQGLSPAAKRLAQMTGAGTPSRTGTAKKSGEKSGNKSSGIDALRRSYRSPLTTPATSYRRLRTPTPKTRPVPLSSPSSSSSFIQEKHSSSSSNNNNNTNNNYYYSSGDQKQNSSSSNENRASITENLLNLK